MKIELYPPLHIHELGKRDNQEDSLWPMSATANDRLFLLCDGMGGHEKGEVASHIVSTSIPEFLDKEDIADGLEDNQLKRSLEYTYRRLDAQVGESVRKMGTTLTLLCFHRRGVTAAHMGDSRIYHIRPGVGILYQSRDHSIAFDLFQSGEITYEEMLNYPKKNIISRAMTPGEENRMRPDIIHITDIQSDDYFYMCSDGMLENMTNKAIVALLSSNATDEKKRKQFITATSKNQDNHTAWFIHIKDVIREDGDELLVNEEPTARCNTINIIPKDATEGDEEVVIVETEGTAKSFLQRIKEMYNYIMRKNL